MLVRLSIALLLLPIAAGAQATTPPVSSETLELIRAATAEAAPKEGALILKREVEIDVDTKGRVTERTYVLGKIFDRDARTAYSQIPIPVQTYFEEATLEYARTIRDDGTVRALAPDAVELKSLPQTAGAVQYSDVRLLTFSLPGLESGTAFEYRIRFNEKRPLVEGAWSVDHLFNMLLRDLRPPYRPRADRVALSRLTLRVPRGTVYQERLLRSKVVPTRRTVGDVDEVVWELRDVPGLRFEEGMPTLDELAPSIAITSLRSWSEIDAWAADRFFPQVDTTGEVLTTARRITEGAPTRRERIARLFAFVQREIQYTAADLDRGGYTPHRASEVLANRYGDCKDQTTLLLSLLRACEIEAYPALLNPHPADQVGELPTARFRHVIVHVPDSLGDLWLDTTPGVTSFDRVFFTNQGCRTFVVDGRGGRLVTTPVDGIDTNVYRCQADLRFREDRGHVRLRLTATGAGGDGMRLHFASLDAMDQQETLRNLVLGRLPKAIIDSVWLSDVRDPRQPFEAVIAYHIADSRDAFSTFATYRSHSIFPLTVFVNLLSLPPAQSRTHDLRFYFPFVIEAQERYIRPDARTGTADLPLPDTLRGRFLTVGKRFRRDGDDIVASWRMEQGRSRIRRRDLPAFTAEALSMRDFLDWTVVYHSSSREETRGTVQRLISEAKRTDDLYRKQSLLDQAVALDPRDAGARIMRGSLALMQNAWTKALEDFAAAEVREPGLSLTHIGQAFALNRLGRVDEALGHAEKAIFLDERGVEPYRLRGQLRYQKKDYRGAVADLRIVVARQPEDREAQISLAMALSHLGRDREALDMVKTLRRSSPTDAATYRVEGYVLTQLKRYDDALAAYQRSLALDSTSSSSYGNIGWVYYLKDDMSRCLTYSERAVALDPEAFYARHNIALARLRLGEIELARSLYEESLELERALRLPPAQGAIDDLRDLVARNIRAQEARAILRDLFNVEATP